MKAMSFPASMAALAVLFLGLCYAFLQLARPGRADRYRVGDAVALRLSVRSARGDATLPSSVSLAVRRPLSQGVAYEASRSRLPVGPASLPCRFGRAGTAKVPIQDEQPQEITATFSIIAVDPDAGICGAAVASKYPAVGKVVPYVRPGVGVFCTQHYHVPKWGEPALDLLAEGRKPENVLTELLRDDPDAELRQLAIMDMQGRAAVHNPTTAPESSRYWGAMTGRYYCCQGNTLTGREVVVAMAAAYEETRGSLADRLMAALIAADCAGGTIAVVWRRGSGW